MNKYKVFIHRDGEDEKLLSRKLAGEDSKTYYGQIQDEMKKGNRQFIITGDIMSDVILKYVIKNNYDLTDVRTDCPESNANLARYSHKMKDDKGYLALVMLEMSNENRDVSRVTLEKYNEVITLEPNGVVITNTIVDEELLETMIDSLHGYNTIR